VDFTKYISTPANTTEAAPLITRLKLTKGRLTGGFVYFPYGPAGTLHFLARIGIHQILPFNTGENFRLDDAVIPFNLGINLIHPPFSIDLVTWNDSSTYAHALTVGFYLDPDPKYDYTPITMDDLKNVVEGYHKP
jgi:hypothetical protein